ncbi:MAG: TIGR03936 family radical SAM-associated protein [Butyricicoccus sp.]
MFKARMKFVKEGRAKYISHLDLIPMQRSMARCQMPLWFPRFQSARLRFGGAAALDRLLRRCVSDFKSPKRMENAVEALNDVFPEGLRAIEIYPLADGGMKVGSIEWSQYRITWGFENSTPKGFADDVRNLFRRPVVEIVKRSKRGEKTVNMRELMRDLTVTDGPDEVTAVVTTAAGKQRVGISDPCHSAVSAAVRDSVQRVPPHERVYF